MRHLTQGEDTADCFDEAVWLQERNLIYFAHDPLSGNPLTVTLKAKRGTGSLLTIATYALDANKKAVIDVTEWLRAFQDTTQFALVDDKCEDPILISCSVAGMINPASLIIPAHRCALDYYKIVPPRMMLQDIGCAPILEFRGHHNADEVEMSPSDNIALVTEGSVTLTAGTDYFVLYEGTGGERDERYPLRPLLCGNKYAAVEWTSATGATKRHTWCVKGASSFVTDKISLQTVDGSYSEIKNRVDGFTLYLDGLSAYDLWYYADIVNSSSVRVSFDGSNWRGVQVAADSVQIPDGDAEFSKLEIKVNYRQYDAFNL